MSVRWSGGAALFVLLVLVGAACGGEQTSRNENALAESESLPEAEPSAGTESVGEVQERPGLVRYTCLPTDEVNPPQAIPDRSRVQADAGVVHVEVVNGASYQIEVRAISDSRDVLGEVAAGETGAWDLRPAGLARSGRAIVAIACINLLDRGDTVDFVQVEVLTAEPGPIEAPEPEAKTDAVVGPAHVEGGWLFVGGTFGGREIPIVEGFRVTLVVGEDVLGGRAPCNRYGTRDFEIDAGVIEIREPAQTALGCASELLREAEEMYVAAFARSEQITLANDELHLTGASDTVLRFERLPDAPIEQISDREWLLESITRNGERIPLAGDESTLTWKGDGAFTATTGCRTLSAEYVVQGDEILSTRSSAEGECPEGLVEQDSLVVQALGDGFTAHVEGGSLIIESRGSLQLTYGAVTDSEEGEQIEPVAEPPAGAAPARPGGTDGPPPAWIDWA